MKGDLSSLAKKSLMKTQSEGEKGQVRVTGEPSTILSSTILFS